VDPGFEAKNVEVESEPQSVDQRYGTKGAERDQEFPMFHLGSGSEAHLSRGDRMMAGVREEKLLTASDLAILCEVDLKTIHNWVDRGRIAHFRTPGRHLRFRAADIAEFLRAWGYSVPRELARVSVRTGLIVGSKEMVSHVTRTLGDTMPLRDVKHPYDALVLAGADPPDVFLVDVKTIGVDVEVDRWLEALNRACPDARIVVLGDDATGLPSFATFMGRADAQGLRTLLLPEVPVANAPSAATAEVQTLAAVGDGLAHAVSRR
jgi:excisionase family DNA binding protein